jgi:hypothetical protein
MSESKHSVLGLSKGASKAPGDNPRIADVSPRRFSAKRKTEAVLRLLRGEDIELVSRELRVTAASLSEWREKFLEGGQEAMKRRPRDERDCEIGSLREKLDETTMANELLKERIGRMEAGRPLARRRSRK